MAIRVHRTHHRALPLLAERTPPVTQSCACRGLSKQSGSALLLSQTDSSDMREPRAVWRQPLQREEKCWLMPGSTDAGRGHADHSERVEARTKSPPRASQRDVCDDYRWLLLHSDSLPLPSFNTLHFPLSQFNFSSFLSQRLLSPRRRALPLSAWPPDS